MFPYKVIRNKLKLIRYIHKSNILPPEGIFLSHCCDYLFPEGSLRLPKEVLCRIAAIICSPKEITAVSKDKFCSSKGILRRSKSVLVRHTVCNEPSQVLGSTKSPTVMDAKQTLNAKHSTARKNPKNVKEL